IVIADQRDARLFGSPEYSRVVGVAGSVLSVTALELHRVEPSSCPVDRKPDPILRIDHDGSGDVESLEVAHCNGREQRRPESVLFHARAFFWTETPCPAST